VSLQKKVETMKAKLITFTVIICAGLGLAFLAGAVLAMPLQEPQASDSAAYYKAKCVACHGQKAEKKFDASIADDQMVEAILKGKKAEKPPNMPGFEAKGVTPDQAKALVAFMKELKASAGAP
jgi:mono/diheme cytochrome c family protein